MNRSLVFDTSVVGIRAVSGTWLHLILLATMLSIVSCKDTPLTPPKMGPVWISYRAISIPQLRCDRINALSLGYDGTMYIATDSGVSSSQRLIWGDMHDSLRYIVDIAGGTEARYAVNALASDDLGNLWMGTAGGGVKRVHSGEKIVGWRTYRYPTIPDDIINTMAADPHPLGEIWIGTPLFGLGRFTPSSTSPFEGTWKSYPSLEVPELGTNQMRSSAFNPQDSSFWFSSLLAVVSFTKSSQWKVFYLPNQYRLTVFGITFDRSNTVWLAQEEGATSFREPNVWGRYTYESTGGILPRGKVNAVLTDGRNIRWFGTNAGLARLRDTTWTLFSSISVPEFASDTITALAYDKRYNLWIGTTNGVLVYNDAGITF